MTQSGGAKNTFLVTLYNSQKRGRVIALPAPPSPWSLELSLNVAKTEFMVVGSRQKLDIVAYNHCINLNIEGKLSRESIM